MKVFLAFSNAFAITGLKKNDIYGLYSYHYAKKDEKLTNTIHEWEDFILDSGIFTYLNGKDASKVDWEKYIYDYGNYVKKHQIRNYVEVDIDKIVGLQEVERLRIKLEKLVGWQTIPVWHINRSYDKWLEICRDYSYICFGAFITDGLSQDKFKHIPRFILDAKKNNCKVHGLGMTDFKWIGKLKFDSVDSSTWSAGMRFGYVDQFNGTKIIKLKKPVNHRFIDYKDVSKYNLNEWIKFVKYAKNNL